MHFMLHFTHILRTWFNRRTYNNNTNNNHDDIYSAVIYGASDMREFTVVPLGQSRSVPGGRPSPCIITQPLS